MYPPCNAHSSLWYVGCAHAQARTFPVLTLECCDTKGLVPPESSFLVGVYGEIENEIDNLDNLDELVGLTSVW